MSALVDALCAPSGDAAALIYDTFNAASFLFDNAAAAAAAAAAFCDAAGIVAGGGPAAEAALGATAVAEPEEMQATTPAAAPRARKRRRRARSCKTREETESQRMTHIAVERNRRRQMNEYLAALRSLMPESYVQRGDQASIVGGAIEFVKELEQQLQSLEAQKRTLARQHKAAKSDATPSRNAAAAACMEPAPSSSNCSSSVTEDAPAGEAPPPFAGFFAYPQYVWRHAPRDSAATAASAFAPAECGGGGGGRPGVADIEVSLVETHASVRVMAPRRPGQLLRVVAGLQALRLAVLHLGVTTLDSLALYTLSVKMEEGCGLTTTDDIAAAVHRLLCIIDAEATSHSQQLLLAAGQ
ncbi:hypothetical protein ACP4OV_000562 [Aristida adscensionis]